MSDYIIDLSGVSVEYVLTDGRTRTLQDFLINLTRGKISRHKSFYALKDVTLKVKKGESLGLIGTNGAGKSTLLKVIAGIIKPTEGSVTIRGRIAPLIELGTGFDPELTGEENIYLNASVLGLSNREIGRRFSRIVEFSEIESFIYSPLRNYSSGMIARLAFSIAVEVEAEILVIDEVLAVGDEGFRKKCQKRIDDVVDCGATLLFVSHSMGEVQRLCDNIFWLEHGKVEASGEAGYVAIKYLLHFDKTVFEDIHEGHPDKMYIDAMFIQGITSGYDVNGKRYYNSENKISRAEFAVFLSKAMGIKKSYAQSKQFFLDVSETHWAARHIIWVYEQGLLDPLKDDRGRMYFHPDDYMTLSDVRTVLSKIDPHKCEEAVHGGAEFADRGEIARIFYDFFDFKD